MTAPPQKCWKPPLIRGFWNDACHGNSPTAASSPPTIRPPFFFVRPQFFQFRPIGGATVVPATDGVVAARKKRSNWRIIREIN